MKFQPENLLVRWNRILNPPTMDEDGWDEEKIKEKLEEAKRFGREIMYIPPSECGH